MKFSDQILFSFILTLGTSRKQLTIKGFPSSSIEITDVTIGRKIFCNYRQGQSVNHYIFKLTSIVLLLYWLSTSFSFQNRVRMYPWKTVRIQDLPDINNNDEFNIPLSPGVNSGAGIYTDTFPLSSAVEQLSGRYERPNLRRTPIHSKVSDYTGELSGSLTLMEWARFNSQFLNFSFLSYFWPAWSVLVLFHKRCVSPWYLSRSAK